MENKELDLAGNPWLELSDSGHAFVLPIDSVQLLRNENGGKSTEIITTSIPEPFIGNPKSARLVLLGLNPGHDPSDESFHKNPDFRSAMFKNLRHEIQQFPFYPLNPAPIFRTSGAGGWWHKRTQELREATGLGCRRICFQIDGGRMVPLPFEKI